MRNSSFRAYNITTIILIVLGLCICIPIVLQLDPSLYWVHRAYPMHVSAGLSAVLLYYAIRLLIIVIQREGPFLSFFLLLPLSVTLLVVFGTVLFSATQFHFHRDSTRVQGRDYHLTSSVDLFNNRSFTIHRCGWFPLVCWDYAEFTPEEPYTDDTVTIIIMEEDNRTVYLIEGS